MRRMIEEIAVLHENREECPRVSNRRFRNLKASALQRYSICI